MTIKASLQLLTGFSRFVFILKENKSKIALEITERINGRMTC